MMPERAAGGAMAAYWLSGWLRKAAPLPCLYDGLLDEGVSFLTGSRQGRLPLIEAFMTSARHWGDCG
ncbi:hypothetical protein [Paenibacillus sp. y28]|uniref:hypothetical protein n=1 Tax=Paenibacillus sp. y28 TaxID=3129110 RepID=UPI003018D6D8